MHPGARRRCGVGLLAAPAGLWGEDGCGIKAVAAAELAESRGDGGTLRQQRRSKRRLPMPRAPCDWGGRRGGRGEDMRVCPALTG